MTRMSVHVALTFYPASNPELEKLDPCEVSSDNFRLTLTKYYIFLKARINSTGGKWSNTFYTILVSTL